MVTIFNILMFPSHGQLSSTEDRNGFQKEKGKRKSRVLVTQKPVLRCCSHNYLFRLCLINGSRNIEQEHRKYFLYSGLTMKPLVYFKCFFKKNIDMHGIYRLPGQCFTGIWSREQWNTSVTLQMLAAVPGLPDTLKDTVTSHILPFSYGISPESFA